MSKFSHFLQSRIFWIQSISISAIALLLVIGFSYAWQAPTCDPTSVDPHTCNVDTPLNTSTTIQTKLGGLNIMDKVGIGTTIPNRQLHIYHPSGVNAELDIQSKPGANNHWAIYNDRDKNQLRFWQGDNRLTITPDGRVGIGTTDPNSNAKLDVKGRIKASAPVEDNDVATKKYVEDYVDAAGGGNGLTECYVKCAYDNNTACDSGFTRIFLFGGGTDGCYGWSTPLHTYVGHLMSYHGMLFVCGMHESSTIGGQYLEECKIDVGNLSSPGVRDAVGEVLCRDEGSAHDYPSSCAICCR